MRRHSGFTRTNMGALCCSRHCVSPLGGPLLFHQVSHKSGFVMPNGADGPSNWPTIAQGRRAEAKRPGVPARTHGGPLQRVESVALPFSEVILEDRAFQDDLGPPPHLPLSLCSSYGAGALTRAPEARARVVRVGSRRRGSLALGGTPGQPR